MFVICSGLGGPDSFSGGLSDVLKTAPAGPVASASNPFGSAPAGQAAQPWGAPG